MQLADLVVLVTFFEADKAYNAVNISCITGGQLDKGKLLVIISRTLRSNSEIVSV